LQKFRTAEVTEWHEFWFALPKRDLLPDRRALDPTLITRLLPSIMILDLTDPPAVRFRLAGTAIVDRYGFNPKGKDFLDLVEEENREQVGQILRLAARHPFAIHSVLNSKFGNGLQVEVEALAFPFRAGERDDVQMISISQPLEADVRLDERPDSLSQVEASKFRFIDLGAGLPDVLKGNGSQ
jgi:hypothetical protein